MNLSICITNKNRSIVEYSDKKLYLLINCLNNINKLTLTNLKIQIVISDWNSDDLDIENWIKENINNPIIEYVVVKIDGFFNRGKGLNIAFKNSKYDNILFLDADMLISNNMIIEGLKTLDTNNAFFPICYSYNDIDHNLGWWRKEGFGNCMVTRKMIVDIKGWRELDKWGKEDNIFIDNLKKKKYNIVRYNLMNFYHQWHPNDLAWKNKYAKK